MGHASPNDTLMPPSGWKKNNPQAFTLGRMEMVLYLIYVRWL